MAFVKKLTNFENFLPNIVDEDFTKIVKCIVKNRINLPSNNLEYNSLYNNLISHYIVWKYRKYVLFNLTGLFNFLHQFLDILSIILFYHRIAA